MDALVQVPVIERCVGLGVKAGEAEAAIDPLAEPGVRAAVANATFEHLVGFELTQDQLKYNATR
jgi:hypothetical protein